MTDDTGPLQHASHSWILRRMSFNCISQCTTYSFVSRSQSCGPRRVTFQQAFNSTPTCFAVRLLSPLAGSQVPASRTTFTETPSFEVCSAKVGSPYLVFHQHLSGERGTTSAGLSIPTCVSNAVSLPSGEHGQLAFRVFGPRPISPTQGILPTFAARVLIAGPCSVTTAASDDEFSMPTNTAGWNRGSHFPPSCWLGRHVQHLLSEFQDRCVVLSTMRPLQRCLSVAADVTPVH